MGCSICGSNGEKRMDVCFDCANIESIIHDGLTMWEQGIDDLNIPAKTAMEKLKLMRAKVPGYFMQHGDSV